METLPMEYFKNTKKPRVVSNLGFRFADTKAEYIQPISGLP